MYYIYICTYIIQIYLYMYIYIYTSSKIEIVFKNYSVLKFKIQTLSGFCGSGSILHNLKEVIEITTHIISKDKSDEKRFHSDLLINK